MVRCGPVRFDMAVMDRCGADWQDGARRLAQGRVRPGMDGYGGKGSVGRVKDR